jgi:uncharacterized protein (DUF433 family)
VAQVQRSTEAITANQNLKAAAAREGNPEEEIHANLNSAGVARQGGALCNWNERIVINPAVLTGKLVIRSTRLAVDFIVGLLAQGWTQANMLRNYPGVTHDDIAACLQYASEMLQAEKVYPLTPAGAG